MGRRRAGHQFGTEPVDIPLEDLSEAQIAPIQADPLLGVSMVTTTTFQASFH